MMTKREIGEVYHKVTNREDRERSFNYLRDKRLEVYRSTIIPKSIPLNVKLKREILQEFYPDKIILCDYESSKMTLLPSNDEMKDTFQLWISANPRLSALKAFNPSINKNVYPETRSIDLGRSAIDDRTMSRKFENTFGEEKSPNKWDTRYLRFNNTYDDKLFPIEYYRRFKCPNHVVKAWITLTNKDTFPLYEYNRKYSYEQAELLRKLDDSSNIYDKFDHNRNEKILRIIELIEELDDPIAVREILSSLEPKKEKKAKVKMKQSDNLPEWKLNEYWEWESRPSEKKINENTLCIFKEFYDYKATLSLRSLTLRKIDDIASDYDVDILNLVALLNRVKLDPETNLPDPFIIDDFDMEEGGLLFGEIDPGGY
jgi:hypothetical protein